MSEKIICLLCGSDHKKVIASYDDPDPYEVTVGVDRKGYFRHWVQCENCSFFYSMYSRDPNILDNIYFTAYRSDQSDWRKSSVEETFHRIIDLPRKESETKFRVEWIKSHIKQAWSGCWVSQGSEKPYRMLDVGGATGVFAYEFQDEDWKSHVIDPDKNGYFVQDKLDIPFRNKMYEPKSFPCSFHLVSLIFVLEHVHDPVGFLRDVRDDLEPNGLVYIEVPDAIAFQLKSHEDDIFNACHLWMFGPQTLLPLLDSCGYDVFALNRTQTKRGHYSMMVLAGVK